MKLMKIEKVTSDAVVANTAFHVDVSKCVEIAVAATTCTMTIANAGADSIVTFTVDGTDAAEKLLNATKIADYLAVTISDLVTNRTNPHKSSAVFELITSYADFEAKTGITFTGDTGPLVTTALS
jgi:hypothetical protein